MKKNELIQELAKDLRPVRRWPRPSRLTLGLGLGAMALTAAVVAILRPRGDGWLKLTIPSFSFSLLFLIVSGLLALSGAVFLSVPGRRWPLMARQALLFSILGLMISASLELANNPWTEPGLLAHGLPCAITTLAMTALVLLVGLRFLSRGASTRPTLSAILSGFAAFAFGLAGISMHCADDHSAHILLWHALIPLVAVSLFVAFIWRRRFRW